MKHYIPYILLIVVLIFWWTTWEKPNYPEIPDNSKTDTLKYQARTFIEKSDSVKKQAVKADSVRIVYVTKWREVKKLVHDTVYKCDSILPIVVNTCDSVIFQDSVLISKYKAIRHFDSLTIARQVKVIESDSIQILSLKKEVKKHKRQKRLLAALSVALGGAAIAR